MPAIVRPIARGRGSERGASLVEFTLVLPMLLVLVFGIVDFGRGFQSWITVTNAAREGARLGATGADSAAICTRVQATVAVSGATCAVTGAQGTTGGDVTVKVNYTLTLITPIGSLLKLVGATSSSTVGNSFPLSSTAVMRLE